MTDETQFHVIATERNASVLVRGIGGRMRGTISADNMGQYWWLSRAVIDPPEQRGKGVGSKMLVMLLEALIPLGCTELRVAPGGYDEQTERQFNYYLKHGFRRVEDGLLIWKPEWICLARLQTRLRILKEMEDAKLTAFDFLMWYGLLDLLACTGDVLGGVDVNVHAEIRKELAAAAERKAIELDTLASMAPGEIHSETFHRDVLKRFV